MERRRTSVRRAGLAGVVLLVLTAATACGESGPIGSSDVAATVNGTDILQEEVTDLVDAQRTYFEAANAAAEEQRAQAEEDAASNPGSAESIPTKEEYATSLDERLAPYVGEGDDTVPTAGAAQVLTTLLNDEIERQALADADGEVTEEQRTAARQSIEEQITQSGVDPADAPQLLVDQAVEAAAVRSALEATAPAEVTDQPVVSDDAYTAQLQAIFEEQKDDYTQLCVDLIITPDEAAATEARARIDAGESFEAVAAEVSTEGPEAATGGGGGCVATADVAGLLGDEANGAQPGDVIGPGSAADGSFIVIRVDRTQVPTFEDVRAQLEQANPNTQGQEARDAAVAAYVSELIAAAVADAEVTVDPRFGTWDAGEPASDTSQGRTAQVVPPVDPEATTTTTEAVTEPSVVPEPAPAGP